MAEGAAAQERPEAGPGEHHFWGGGWGGRCPTEARRGHLPQGWAPGRSRLQRERPEAGTWPESPGWLGSGGLKEGEPRGTPRAAEPWEQSELCRGWPGGGHRPSGAPLLSPWKGAAESVVQIYGPHSVMEGGGAQRGTLGRTPSTAPASTTILSTAASRKSAGHGRRPRSEPTWSASRT